MSRLCSSQFPVLASKLMTIRFKSEQYHSDHSDPTDEGFHVPEFDWNNSINLILKVLIQWFSVGMDRKEKKHLRSAKTGSVLKEKRRWR